MIEAVKTKITVKRIHKEKVTAGGIVLQHEDNPNPTAEVMSIGEEVKAPIKLGDIIYLDWRYVFQLSQDDEDKIYVTDESNVLAVIR